MGYEYQKVYTVKDINQAFNMGLCSAIFVLEKSLGLPIEYRMDMLKGLRQMINEKEVKDYES